MGPRYISMFMVLILHIAVSTEAAPLIKELAAVNDLIERIHEDTWDDEETLCVQKTLGFLNNVKNQTLWAAWLWESNQQPVGVLYGSRYQLGNFDQCMNPPWLTTHPDLRTQYCMTEVKMTRDIPLKENAVWDPYAPIEKYINTATKRNIDMDTLYWGVCVPSSCHPRSVGKIVRHMYSGTQYAPLSAAPAITVQNCQVAGEKLHYSIGSYVFIGCILILGAIALGSTIHQSLLTSNDGCPGFTSLISKSFCMKQNYNTLMNRNSEDVHTLHGIRSISTFLVIFTHQILFVAHGPINLLDFEKSMASLSGIVMNLYLLVDTFLMMSGLLQVRVLKSELRRQEYFLLILRYLRLIGPVAVTIFYIMTFATTAGTGPLWFKYQYEADLCLKTWPLSFLMINTNIEEVCHIVTWYISCDYQLAIFGTVLIYVYKTEKKLGYVAFGLAMVVSCLIPAVFTYWYRLPPVPFPDVSSVMNSRALTYLNLNYTKSYHRANSFLVGVAMGYLMLTFKPTDYRRAISKKWSLIGFITCAASLLLILGLDGMAAYRECGPLVTAVAVGLKRAVWAFLVCCLIAFCEYGTVPLIDDFLKLPVFVPLSRLSYGIYLIHNIIILQKIFSARAPVTSDFYFLFVDSLGTLVMSACFSFAMWLLVEAPCNNLSTALFRKRYDSRIKKQDKTSLGKNR